MSSFNVELKKVVDDSYEIETGYDLADKLVEDLPALLPGRKRLALVTDDNVDGLYAQAIDEKLKGAGYSVIRVVIPAGEKSKTRAMKEYVEDTMLSAGLKRDCAVIAVGGGVVTDLAGFVAGTFGRGVPFINYATTLLAAADASVGGKTAVDTPLATNLIGLFNQPEKVYIDIATWKTLPERQLSSGLAETIKHGCLGSRRLFEYLEENIERVLALDKEACAFISEENCRVKYDVVMKDERESGLREILNLGHTIGRAIETESDYRLLHGEAVSIGLMGAAKLSVSRGLMSEAQEERLRSLLLRAKLPVSVPEYIDREALVKKLYTDKKVRDGKLRFVLQKGIGDMACFGENIYSVQISEEEARSVIMRL